MDMDYITTNQLAADRGCCDSHIRGLIRAGKLPAVLMGKTWLIRRADAEGFKPRPKGRPKKIQK